MSRPSATGETRARWQTTKVAGVPCGACGTLGTCTVSPDHVAFKCWRDGGKVHHVHGNHNGNGHDTGYVGRAHRKHAPDNNGPAKVATSETHPTAEEAVVAAGKRLARGVLAGTWPYRAADGAEVMRVARFDLPNGDKQFRPVHRVKVGWRVGDPPGPLPLYRLPELPASGPLVLCEGEKAADAARGVGLPATTSAHGSAAAAKTDWSPAAGRPVLILPDADPPGRKYAREVATLLAKLEPPAAVKVLELPGLPVGGDFVEFLGHARPGVAPAAVHAEVLALAESTPYLARADLVGGPVLTCLADVEPVSVSWLWRHRIPLGRITLFVGRPGEGKSFATCDWAARVTTGTPWPDGTPCPKGSVILISAEDDPADTIRPRLDAHRADVRRVHLLSAVRRVGEDGRRHDVMFTLADVAALEAALRAVPDCRLIVVDPIGSFLGGDTDAHRDNEVRGVLAPVARLAERYGPAVLVVAHRRKSNGSVADDLALGSRAFTGIARAVWHLSRDKDDKHRRLLLPGKNNLAPEGDGLAFAIAGSPPSVVWERDPVTMSADDALAAENGGSGGTGEDRKPGPEPAARNQSSDWLRTLLAVGAVQAKQVEREAKEAGLSLRTVRRAADEIGVIRGEKCAFTGKYQWRLPRGGEVVGQEPADTENVADLANQGFSTRKSGVSGGAEGGCPRPGHLDNQGDTHAAPGPLSTEGDVDETPAGAAEPGVTPTASTLPQRDQRIVEVEI